MHCDFLHRKIKSLPLYVKLFFFLGFHVESISCAIVFHKLHDIMIECFGVNSCVSGLNIAPAFKIFVCLHPFNEVTLWELSNDTTRVSTCSILQTEQSYYCMTLISIMAHSRQPTVAAMGETCTAKKKNMLEKKGPMCLPLQCSFVLNHESILHCYSSVPCSRLPSLPLATLSRLGSNIRQCILQSVVLEENQYS